MIIKDCIHRFINVPKVCKQLMDTFEFQRLRKIKQLGFVYLVYPSADHSRFEHSLGVMHLAGQVIDALRTHGAQITDREKELVQVAGLLHDVGHIAFSHLLDDTLKDEGVDSTHEDRSLHILDELNHRYHLFTEQEQTTIGRMIKGQVPYACKKPFLYEIVCNQQCGLDVDRMDYLQRDAYKTGMQSFQPDYLIQCMRVNQDGRLVFLRKAETEIRLLYDTRKRMFTLVYRHKTVLRIEKLVRRIMSNEEVVGRINECLSTGKWLTCTDEEVWGWLMPNTEHDLLYTREWDKDDMSEETFKHCSTMTEEEIRQQVSRVLFL